MSHLKIVKPEGDDRFCGNDKVIRLKVEIIAGMYWEEPYSFQLDIRFDASLMDLHTVIQRELKFEDDHLFSFTSGRTPRSRVMEYRPDDNSDDFSMEGFNDISLNEVFPLPKAHSLYYHFDFGDGWLAEIRRVSSQPGELSKSKYKVVSRSGKRPVQYPDLDCEGTFVEVSEFFLDSLIPKLPETDKVYLYLDPVPMNWGWRKLSKVIAEETDLEFTDDKILLFYNRTKDRLKLLFKEAGMEQTLDRFLHEQSFVLPAPEAGKSYLTISRENLSKIFKMEIL
ncbi:IS1096 element passenger TnpR family protein [Pseudobacteriovorax antillogorgiicola]|uniref:IS66 Orf2 like protein n=1 Tax=Pseudobacteriovorax antillogorgiicola TaxID=1513793 RepID=A0A1Y6CDS5_9BACT|nr:IS66 family insertion sequence element accessory protein TnpB [Pseudobacteriovorax antillogorgiicola]TCS51667.1 IS66 Orf2 like protein [Pseudobacteriovorax antillogorgiicola]SMF48951.1 IS66 Orf2 like protein [Pseudobacteriovorax antillogorgiicola]